MITVREPVATAATVPLPIPLPGFAALPVGALFDNHRYEVTAVLSQSAKLNAYLVLDHTGRRCSQCGSTDNAADERYCSNCGIAIPDTPATYLLREALDTDMWTQEALVAEFKLWHKGLVNVYRIFQDRPYGTLSRSYLVSDPDEGSDATTLHRPQPEEKVLFWGQQLAEAIAAL
ncbi:MAG: hypothetical protein WBD79_07040, partial [Anaerolineae bacterium]